VYFFLTASPDRGKTILVRPHEGSCSDFINFSTFMYSYILLMSVYDVSDVMIILWQMVRTRSDNSEYDEVPESSNCRRGAFHPPEPPPSPPTPPPSIEQLLAPLNAIMQRLTTIDERQAGQSQQYQQLQESYFDFLATQPPEFAETIDPLEANH
jgi:hypothetical protein